MPRKHVWMALALAVLGCAPKPPASQSVACTWRVFFDSGSTTLSPQGKRLLTAYAGSSGACSWKATDLSKDVFVCAIGHTDTSGSASVNRQLSLQRAAVATAYLIEQGVPRDRIAAVGMGGDQPLVQGSDDAQNRRVEFIVGTSRDMPKDCK